MPQSSASRLSRLPIGTGCTQRWPLPRPALPRAIQPIVGAMLAVARPPEMGSTGVDWLVLLAKDEQGYGNLCHLVSSAHLDRPVELDPHVAFAALEKSSEGLIALTAGSEGALARLLADGQKDTAKIYLDRLQALFPDRLYIEIIRRNDPGRGGFRRRADRSRLRAGSAARCHQSGRLFGPELPRRARRDAVHRPVRLHREQRPHRLPRRRHG